MPGLKTSLRKEQNAGEQFRHITLAGLLYYSNFLYHFGFIMRFTRF